MLGGLAALTVRVSGGDGSPEIRVLAALLGDTAEAVVLREAVRSPGILSVANTRAGVLAALNDRMHDVIVFPMQDQDRLPTAPLIRACLREQPSSTVLVLCAAPPSRSGALLAASRAGAQVLVTPTAADISSALTRATRVSGHDVVPDCETLASVQPLMLQQLLCAASRTVAMDGRVRTLAQELHVSTRTLSRHTQRAGFGSPRALLSAARLLWACALMESTRYDVNAVARKTGFRDVRSLTHATSRYAVRLSPPSSAARLPTFQDALRHIVGSLGGRLAS